jgi:hypothetical protein
VSKDAVATDPDADRRAVRTVWVRPVGTEMYSEKLYTPEGVETGRGVCHVVQFFIIVAKSLELSQIAPKIVELHDFASPRSLYDHPQQEILWLRLSLVVASSIAFSKISELTIFIPI